MPAIKSQDISSSAAFVMLVLYEELLVAYLSGALHKYSHVSGHEITTISHEVLPPWIWIKCEYDILDLVLHKFNPASLLN